MNNSLFFTPGAEVPVILAPMAGVTDAVFRGVCRAYGADFSFTEMVSAKGLHYNNANTGALLETAPEERASYGVQLFGSDPDILAESAHTLSMGNNTGLALIDINMGCPARKIVKNGEGSALMLNEPLAFRVIEAVVRASRVPVSVKFRKGFDDAHLNAVSFAVMAEQAGASMITLHPRTREQMYEGRADWDVIAAVKQAVHIPVIGNGDILCAGDALRMLSHTGCDGVMVARGAEGNPFIFEEIRAALDKKPYSPPSPAQRIEAAIAHVRRYGDEKGCGPAGEMRKHIAWYIAGMRGAGEMRRLVMSARGAEEMLALLEDFYNSLLP